jgi:hypothetical protein
MAKWRGGSAAANIANRKSKRRRKLASAWRQPMAALNEMAYPAAWRINLAAKKMKMAAKAWRNGSRRRNLYENRLSQYQRNLGSSKCGNKYQRREI